LESPLQALKGVEKAVQSNDTVKITVKQSVMITPDKLIQSCGRNVSITAISIGWFKGTPYLKGDQLRFKADKNKADILLEAAEDEEGIFLSIKNDYSDGETPIKIWGAFEEFEEKVDGRKVKKLRIRPFNLQELD
jgi:hypothetical protein